MLFSSSVEGSATTTDTDSAQVVVGVAVAVPVLVLFNAVLLFCLIKRRAIKSSSASSSASGKTSLNGGLDSKNSASEGKKKMFFHLSFGGWTFCVFLFYLLFILIYIFTSLMCALVLKLLKIKTAMLKIVRDSNSFLLNNLFRRKFYGKHQIGYN